MKRSLILLLLLILVGIFPMLLTNYCFSCLSFKITIVTYFIILIFILSKIANNPKIINMIDKKSNYFFIIIIAMTTFLFIRAGLFQGGFIFLQDFSFHYSNVLMFQKTFDDFQPFLSWSNDYGLGIPGAGSRPFLQIMIDLLYFPISNIIPFELFFRFFIFIIFLLPLIAIYIFIKKITRGSLAILASMMWLSQNHFRFIIGNIDLYAGIPLFIGFLYFVIKYLEKKRTDYLFLSALFMSATLYFHHILALFSLLFVLLLIIIYRKRSFYKTLYVYVPILFLSWFTFFVIQPLDTRQIINAILTKTAYGNLKYTFETFVNENIFTFPLFLIASLAIFKTKEKYFVFIIPIVVIILICSNFLRNTFIIFNAIHPEKMLLISKIFYTFVIIFFVQYILQDKLKISYKKYVLILVLAMIITDFTLDFSAIILSWTNIHSPIFSEFYGRSFENIFGLSNSSKIFGVKENADLQQTIEWIKNLSTDSRIMFEGSWAEQKFNGNNQQMLPFWIGKRVVSALRVYDGIFFDKPILNYSFQEFSRKLQLTNIEYLVVWSPEFKKFLSSNPNFDNIFMSKNNLLEIYRFQNATHSYVDYNISTLNVTVKKLTDYNIVLNVTNAKKGDLINVGVLYNEHYPFWGTPSWASEDQNKAELSKGLKIDNLNSLLRVELKQDGNYIVQITYRNGIVEKILQTLPFAILLFILGIIIVLKRNYFAKLK